VLRQAGMEQIEFVSGFKDLKTQLQIKCNLQKPLEEIYLWFSDINGDLYVHDYEDHKQSLLLAITNDKKRKIYLAANGPAKKLIDYVIVDFKKSTIWQSEAEELNHLFKLHGSFPMRFMK
jgi:hypothetical protein